MFHSFMQALPSLPYTFCPFHYKPVYRVYRPLLLSDHPHTHLSVLLHISVIPVQTLTSYLPFIHPHTNRISPLLYSYKK